MDTPLSPNWPVAWVAGFNLLLSPLKAYILPKVPEAWRYTAAGAVCFAFTALAAWLTPLLASEILLQGGVLLAMVMGGYAAARSRVGVVTGLGAAGAGLATSGGLALILPAAFAQDPTAAEGAKALAGETAKFWLAWALSVFGGWISRKIDGREKTRHENRLK